MTETTGTTTLMDDVISLENDDDAWTWMDDDPSVAWGDEDSYHGRLAAIYLAAGWESCYHRGSRFHFNVKVNGHARYRGYSDKVKEIRETRGDSFNETLFDQIAEREYQNESEQWWGEVSWAEDDDGMILRHKLTDGGYAKFSDVWGCGRSGGYVNVPKVETNGQIMVRLAAWLAREVEGFNSYDAGRYAAEYALDLYDEERIEAMSSDKACGNCGAAL